jgi:hypothetical protein
VHFAPWAPETPAAGGAAAHGSHSVATFAVATSVPAFLLAPPSKETVQGFAISAADLLIYLREALAFHSRARKANPAAAFAETAAMWFAGKYPMSPARRVGFAYSLWHALEVDCASGSATAESAVFIAMFNGDAPPDFLAAAAALRQRLAAGFKVRAEKHGTLSRAALQTMLRRLLPWTEVDDFDALMTAADNSIPFGAVGTFGPDVFAEHSLFCGALLYLQLCSAVAYRVALLHAVTRVNAAAPAAAPDGAAGGFANHARRRASLVNVARTVGEVRRTSIVLPMPVMGPPAAPPITFGDVVRAVLNVDGDKPRAEIDAFLGRCLGWDLSLYDVGDNLPPGTDVAVMRQSKQKELSDRTLDRARLLQAMGATHEQRVTPVPTWPYMKGQRPRFGIAVVGAPVPVQPSPKHGKISKKSSQAGVAR